MWLLISPINFILCCESKPLSQNFKLGIPMMWITKLQPSRTACVSSLFGSDGNLQFDKGKCIFTTMTPTEMLTPLFPANIIIVSHIKYIFFCMYIISFVHCLICYVMTSLLHLSCLSCLLWDMVNINNWLSFLLMHNQYLMKNSLTVWNIMHSLVVLDNFFEINSLLKTFWYKNFVWNECYVIVKLYFGMNSLI